MKQYIFNLKTTKIELHFEKSEYGALTAEQKADLKSAFLWSRTGGCWVSRAKEPNLWNAKRVAAKLGFTEEQRQGERLSFSEQVERQAERAEQRAERYEQYAENATQRGVALQQPLNRMHGDIAFFTQPIIAGHAGSQAFARQREKMFAQYERGFEEYRKSNYFQDRARTARGTADGAKYRDIAYLDRRIKECKSEIKARKKNIVHYEKILSDIENGKEQKQHDGTPVTAETVTSWMEHEYELIEKAIDKQAFLEACVDQCGGVRFSRDTIKVGYHVKVKDGRYAEFISAGPQNITYRILAGGAKGMVLKAAYYDFGEFFGLTKAEALFKAVDYYLMQTNEKHIPWARMSEIATVLKGRLIEDDEEEAYRYLAGVVELSDIEAEYFGLDMERYRDGIGEDADSPAVPSSTGGDYSPTGPWDAPGMSSSDFI